MSIYRGAGGASDATNDATVNAVAGYAAAAANSATAAATSATAAATSASNANTSVTSATTQASNAATSASNAASSASNAASQATSAGIFAGASSASYAAAVSSASDAATSANEAADSAVQASSSAYSAAGSYYGALDAATQAGISADNALAIYGDTTAMNAAVTDAQTAATNAATSASSAATSASNALTYRDAASGYASNANASYVAAAAAAASATTTANSFTGTTAAATTAATQAAASASAAANSASAASSSATQAASSASTASAIVTGVASSRPSIRPSLLLDFADTRVLDPRITFTRASTATFYDNNTSAVAEQNLLLQSQTFDNASWTKTNSTVTANVVAASDGTMTADKLAENATTGVHGLQPSVTVSAGSVTVSVFAKAAERSVLQICFGSGISTQYANFDLSTGVVSQSGGSPTTSIVESPTGSGWYRCVITITALAATSNLNLLCADSTTLGRLGTYAGTDGSGIYIWGAQMEQRSSVTAYTATTTAAITNYIPAMQTAASGAARFDCVPVGRESLGLLIEESRTNLLTYSDQFDNANWTKTAATIVSNTIIAPDGTLTGDKLVADTTSSVHIVAGLATVVSGTAYMFSVYLKAGEETTAWLWNNVGGAVASFNLSTGTATGSGVITSVGNGWYRCAIPYTPGGTVGQVRVYPRQSTAYVGDGWSGLYVWGGQLEAGAFATSYIPTVASQVTRATDAASMTGTNFSSWYNIAQGTLYGEYNTGASSSGSDTAGNSRGLATFSDGTSTNEISLARALTSFIVNNNSVTQASLVLSGLAANTSYKVSGGYSTDYFQAAKNATLGTADTAGLIPASVNTFYLGRGRGSNAGSLNGTIKRFAYYPQRLSDTELQGVTS